MGALVGLGVITVWAVSVILKSCRDVNALYGDD